MAQPDEKKVERFEWAKPGDKGRAESLAIADLLVDKAKDGGYQRDEISEVNTLNIARAFSWELFGTLIVFERPNGKKYVVDGQQRLSGARRRGDIHFVPCRVFRSDGREHEAKAFVDINCNRKAVRSAEKFLARVRGAVEPEKSIAEWLSRIGLRVVVGGSDGAGVDFPAILIQTWVEDATATRKALMVQKQILAPDETLHSSIHKGLWYLIRNDVDFFQNELLVNKLKVSGGKPAIVQSIRRIQIEKGNEGASHRNCALGILKLLNFKRKRKLSLNNGDATG